MERRAATRRHREDATRSRRPTGVAPSPVTAAAWRRRFGAREAAPVHRTLASLMVALVLGGAVRDASADGSGFSIGSRPVWFVNAGLTGGAALGVDTRGGFVGGELGLVRLRDARVVGLYADAYYDFGVDRTYVTAGPELAWIRRSASMPLALGVDAGGAMRAGDGTAWGATGRVFANVAGALSLFARYSYLDDDADRHVIHVGATLKFPLGPPFGAGTRR